MVNSSICSKKVVFFTGRKIRIVSIFFLQRLEMDMLRHIQVHKKRQAKAVMTQTILNSITEEFQ